MQTNDVIELLSLGVTMGIGHYVLKKFRVGRNARLAALAIASTFLASFIPFTDREATAEVAKLIPVKEMKKVVYDKSSPESVKISIVPIPSVTKTYWGGSKPSVVVKVHSATLNPVDNYRLSEIPFVRWFFRGPGMDFSGTVIGVLGESNYKVGDNVYGVSLSGTFQQYLVTPSMAVGKAPTNWTLSEAATLGVAGMTSYQALAPIVNPGDKVLIIGASGGCGSYGVQIAKALGATVTAICSTKNIPFVTSLGASQVIAYDKPDFEKNLKDKPKFNVVYDTVTRQGTDYEKISKEVLSENGQYAFIRGKYIQTISNVLKGIIGLKREFVLMTPNTRDFDSLSQMASKGVIKPVQVNEMKFTDKDVQSAMKQISSLHTTGKIVLRISE